MGLCVASFLLLFPHIASSFHISYSREMVAFLLVIARKHRLGMQTCFVAWKVHSKVFGQDSCNFIFTISLYGSSKLLALYSSTCTPDANIYGFIGNNHNLHHLTSSQTYAYIHIRLNYLKTISVIKENMIWKCNLAEGIRCIYSVCLILLGETELIYLKWCV